MHRGNPDRSKINTSKEYEIRYWTHKFGVSSQQLNEAIKQAGNSPDAVQQALKK
jgi:hypothetical protein